MRAIDVQVLIVGAGPVGATAALLLARHGIASLVVDRRDGPHRAPQAHVVNPRSLEIFRALEIDTGALRAAATPPADGSHVSFVTTLAGTELGRLPYERQDDDVLAVTPEPLLNLPQHRLEPILVAHLAQSPATELRWRHEWQSLEQDATGVTSHVRDLASGETLLVRSRWVLAADGAGSRVRKALGVAMEGPDQLQAFMMIHFEADLRALVRDRPAILYWVLDPACAGTFVAHAIDHTWVFMHRFDPATEPAATFTPQVCAALVRRAIGADVDLTVRDVSPWSMTAQVAERFRDGRVFLVGDSAHRFPPSGGLGLNTGVQDAHNLAWKLAWVANGDAGDGVLDTYEVERRPVARRNAEQSLVNAMGMLQLFIELGVTDDVAASGGQPTTMLATDAGRARVRDLIAAQQDHFDMLGLQLGFTYAAGALVPDGSSPSAPANPVRDYVPTATPGARLPHAWVEHGGVRRSILDLLDPTGFTLIAAAGGDAWRAAAGSSSLRCLVAGREFVDPGNAWQRLCELEPDGAVLIRPDQHVAWRAGRSPVDPATVLASALRRILSH